MLEVTQQDRDAAAAYLRMIPGFAEEHAQSFEDGAYDHLPDALPQAFARRAEQARLAATPALSVNREAIARAICTAMGDEPEREGPFSEWYSESPYARAADAILSLPASPASQGDEERARDAEWAREMGEMARQQAATATRPIPELQAITRAQYAFEADRWERIATALAFRTSPVGSDERVINLPQSSIDRDIAALTPVSPLCLKGVDDAK